MYSRHWFASLCGGMFYVLFMVSVGSGKVIYVDAGAGLGGDGTSWGTAYKYLQDALYEPPAYGDEIWVAAGTYKPDKDEGGNVDPNDRDASFELIDDVALYGGFPVGGGMWEDRDPNNYETILSGDLYGNDSVDTKVEDLLDDPNRSENSYHVVDVSDTSPGTILDGFTISDGNANGSIWRYFSGGGIYGYHDLPGMVIIDKCTISDNSARYGGGLHECDDAITNGTINDNSAKYGGGLCYCDGSITNCTINDNSAKYGGGGLHMCDSAITDCTISDNLVSSTSSFSNSDGGGLHYCDGAITNCTISGNSARYGGGLLGCRGPITNCTIIGNSAEEYGGGLQGCSGSITNCTISGNSTGVSGGGLQGCYGMITNCAIKGNSAEYGGGLNNCDGSITSCTINDNSAWVNGGGLYWCDGPFTNCTISGNSTEGYGGGICYSDESITNCTIIGNSAQKGGGLYRCNGKISICTIISNSADYGGGLYDCDGPINNCTISGNSADNDGGGLYRCNGKISICTIIGNSAENGGGVYYYDRSHTMLTNCTFHENTATKGNSIICDSHDQLYPSMIILSNCILWDGGEEIWNNDGSSITITYSDICGGWEGLGNIDVDPLFVREGFWDPNETPEIETDVFFVEGDYHLRSEAGRWDPNSESWVIDSVTSPCIDKGNPGKELGEEPASIHNVRINMGAYGGTSEASKTPAGWGLLADLTNDGIVNGEDFGWQAMDWLKMAEEQAGDLNRDGIVDCLDLWWLVEDWLGEASWYE